MGPLTPGLFLWQAFCRTKRWVIQSADLFRMLVHVCLFVCVLSKNGKLTLPFLCSPPFVAARVQFFAHSLRA